jgi:hypothetical protein
MEDSILTSTKKALGIAEDYTNFDEDIIMHLNTVFSTLTQLGVGPPEGFMIEDDSSEWSDFIGQDLEYNQVKSYAYQRVKRLFDPPQTSFAIESMDRQIQEMEVRLSIHREETGWVDPESVTV